MLEFMEKEFCYRAKIFLFFLEIVRNRSTKRIVLGATSQLDKLMQSLGTILPALGQV